MDGDKKIADVNKETAKGVTELLASNPTYEGASGRTTNYSLPLYERGDNFKILTDQNIAMSIIDTALADNAGEFDSLKNKVATVEANIRQLGNSLENTNSTVTALLSRLSDVEDAVEDIPTIKSDLISQNNLIKTLTNRVLVLENERTDVTNRLSGHDSEIDHLNKKTKAGYKYTTITNSSGSMSLNLYKGNQIESSKYLITLSATNANNKEQSCMTKMWVVDNGAVKGLNNPNLNIELNSNSDLSGNMINASLTADTSGTMLVTNCNITVGNGSFNFILSGIPVY